MGRLHVDEFFLAHAPHRSEDAAASGLGQVLRTRTLCGEQEFAEQEMIQRAGRLQVEVGALAFGGRRGGLILEW